MHIGEILIERTVNLKLRNTMNQVEVRQETLY